MGLDSCSLICWLTLAAVPAAAQPSPACTRVIDATHKQSTTPNHMVVVQSGHPNAEIINLPDATSVKFPQGWVKTGPGFKDDPPDRGANLPTVDECRQRPDDALASVAADVFAVHIVRDTKASDGTIWIAKATGLPIKCESDATVGERKAHLSSTWRSENIHAPVVK